MINATKIAKELNSEAKIVNKALLALGFMDKVFNGYTNIHELGTTKEKNGNSFVIWKEEILDIDVFVDKVKELTESVKE